MYENEFYKEERVVTYKGERYSVRDNGAIFRHALIPSMPRKLDETWTFGKKDKKTGYMFHGGARVHIIVARAFHGEHDSKIFVVDHIDTNRCNNRADNLRWFTKLENALNNPVTRKKITYLCGGDIQKFIDNPSCLQELAGPYQDVMWMRTVTPEEARNAYERVMHWANTPSKSISQKEKVGEWVYEPFETFEKGENVETFLRNSVIPKYESVNYTSLDEMEEMDDYNDYSESLTPNVLQENWRTPTEFPLCPNEIKEGGMQEYFQNLEVGKLFCKNELWESKVFDFAISNEKDKVWVVCDSGEKSNKRWSLTEIMIEKEHYIHSCISTYFQQDGAMKYFTLIQGKEWEGGEVFDDLC